MSGLHDDLWRPAGPLLDLVVRYAVRVYFDDWHQAHRWRVREGWPDIAHRHQGVDGACDRRHRVIYVAPARWGRRPGDPLQLAVLIHELVHAATSADHDLVFRHRLGRTAARAGQLGATELHGALQRDLANCDKAAWSEAERRVYLAVGAAVSRLGPMATLDDVERHLRATLPELGDSKRPLRQRFGSLECVYVRELERIAEHLAPRAWPWSVRPD